MRNKVKLHHHTYTIHLADHGKLMDNFGTTLFDDMSIHIEKSLVQSKRESTLAHEILHALLEESGAKMLLAESEELFVRTLENIFYFFLKDNTDFYK